MTNKIQRTQGKVSETLEVGDKTFKLSPLTFGFYGEMEAYVCSLRADPITLASEASASLPETSRPLLWDAAVRAAMYAKVVPASEIANFEKSMAGIAWKLWKCLEPNHAEEIKGYEDALLLLTQIGKERFNEVVAKISIVSGEEDLKK